MKSLREEIRLDIIYRESPCPSYSPYFFMILLSLITFRKVEWVEARKDILKKEIQLYRDNKYCV